MLKALARFTVEKVRLEVQRSYSDYQLPHAATTWLEELCDFLHPKNMYICKGTVEEREALLQELIDNKVLVKCQQQNNCYVVRSDVKDMGRDTSRVFIGTSNKSLFISTPPLALCKTDGCVSSNTPENRQPVSLLSNQMTLAQMQEEIKKRFRKAMRGRKMYAIPFVLGSTGDTQIQGMQLTDHCLTALLTMLMVKSGYEAVMEMSKKPNSSFQDFVKLVHCSGVKHEPPHWPTDLDRYIIINVPERREIWSYGSSHWDNSVLVKEAVSLQMASFIGCKQKFMTAHMSVVGVETAGTTMFIGLMGPSGCGKSVMAALSGTSGGTCIPRTSLVSDDVTWLQYQPNKSKMYAINPHIGVFSLLKDVNINNTPELFKASQGNAILLNCALSGEDSAWWEGQDFPDKDNLEMTDWRGKKWEPDGPRAAHPQARFCTRLVNISNLNPNWNRACGVPLSAIAIMARRNIGYPLVMELNSWEEGLLIAASLHTRYHDTGIGSDMLWWDPLGCKEYMGYNLCKMMENWMSLASEGAQLPKMFLVNLFLLDNATKSPIWPGYEDNYGILKWIVERVHGCVDGRETPMGVLPMKDCFCYPDSIGDKIDSLFSYSVNFWQEEINYFAKLMDEQYPTDIKYSLLEKAIENMKKKLSQTCPDLIEEEDAVC